MSRFYENNDKMSYRNSTYMVPMFWLYHVKVNQGNSVKQQWCEVGFLQNPFKTAKFVEQFGKKWQNNPSGNSHIFLNNFVEEEHGLYSKVLILHTYILEERAMCKLQVAKPKGHKFTQGVTYGVMFNKQTL